MNRYKKLIALLLCYTSVVPFTYTYNDFFDEIDNMFDHQQRKMKKHMKKMDETFKKSLKEKPNKNVNIFMQEKDSNVVVTLNNIEVKDQTFDAEFNNRAQTLIITTPAGTMKIAARDNFLSVQFSYEQHKETKKDTEHGVYMSSGASQIGKTLSGHTRLADARINYNAETKTLTVIIPLEKAEKEKNPITKIPVHVK